jgi:signal transduction histidine kinase
VTSTGVGLRNMHDRLGAVHGRLEVSSEPGRGTIVLAAVPLAPFERVQDGSDPATPRAPAV